MNSLERFEAAIGFREVDRMPTDLHNFAICANRSGQSFDKFILDPEAMADMHIAQRNEFGHDVLLIENGTASLAQALGCEVIMRRDDPPVVHKALLSAIDELDKLIVSDRLLDGPLISANLKTIRILKMRLGDDAVIMGRGDQGPFSLASQLAGMMELLSNMADEDYTEDIDDLLELSTQAGIICCSAMLDAGAHCTSIGDSTAGPDVISPAMYDRFALPYERKLISAIHEKGGKIALHICGNATRVIPSMIATGADILEIDQKTDLKAVWPLIRGKTAILGQISPLHLMNGTPEEIRSETEEMLETVGGRSATGVILGPGCALGATTPFENVHAMLDLVLKN